MADCSTQTELRVRNGLKSLCINATSSRSLENTSLIKESVENSPKINSQSNDSDENECTQRLLDNTSDHRRINSLKEQNKIKTGNGLRSGSFRYRNS